MRPLWVGSDTPRISRLEGGALTEVIEAGRPSFLAEHPSGRRLYAVDEGEGGAVAAFAVEDGALSHTGATGSGGSGPCHLLVHPGGSWLYVSNYGDGTAAAIGLDAEGDLTEDRVELSHSGSGPRQDRQEASHAHSATLSPGGGWLIIADLGTDELRSYRLQDGRPVGDPVLSAMPAGSGPRHTAVAGDLVYVAGELSCEVVTVRWHEDSGRADVLGTVGVTTAPVRSGEESTLSHLELLGPTALVVGVRGADTLAVVGIGDDGVASALRAEVSTVAWPRHLCVVDDTVLVAGERADLIGVHPVRAAGEAIAVGELARTVAAAAPMCLLPTR